MNILEVKNVRKSFGNETIINGLSFSVKEHSVFGFIGKNGAGKTTTMKMILGLLQADQGEITVCGEPVVYGETKTNQYIGYLPDVPEYYSYMTPKEYLSLCGKITGMSSKDIKKRSEELLELVGLGNVNKKIAGFSRGMKQRLGIAQALLNRPRLLICDEPTSALDPIGRKEILDILSVVKEHTTVVFSTHILSDVERICDSIGLLNDGELVLNGNLAELKSMSREEVVLVQLGRGEGQDKVQTEIEQLPYVTKVKKEDQDYYISLKNIKTNGPQLLQFLLTKSVSIIKYEVKETTLENLFMEVVE